MAEAYDIERNGTIVKEGNVGLTYKDTGLTADTEYTYRVRAVNGEAKSQWTPEFKQKTKAAPTEP
ncbi:fibronectin type III domain-containing protein [Carnobacterium maltaromaticum]|uniref:fibronectin type III domain-containing protein n=1 Tax=Carnobacterium maltaromaticum TaxID=2751 RepID=UPI00026C87CB|nr:fibronectin type III domain-containing protein [Carnobacterium maltaromaticum]